MKVSRLEGAKVKNSAEPSGESEWVLGAAGIGSAEPATNTDPAMDRE
jgi:hypothetical protein